MVKCLGILFFLIHLEIIYCQSVSPELGKYVQFLDNKNTTCKDYILNLFKTHDIVLICERYHGEITQYDLINDIVSSDYFIKNVGNLFTEIGSVDSRINVNHFIKTKFTTEKEKQKYQVANYRTMFFPIWEKTNSYDLLGRINDLNSKLDSSAQINWFPSDVRKPNKSEISNIDSLRKYFNLMHDRDSIIASNVITKFDEIQLKSSRKKCLIIMNYRHAFSKNFYTDDTNVGAWLFKKYGSKFSNVLLNNFAPTLNILPSDSSKPKRFQNYTEIPIQNGKWDAAFRIAHKENVGFDFNGSPFGQDSLDIFPYTKNNETYASIFTGFVFYLPFEKHVESFGIPNFTDDGYLDTLYLNLKIFNQAFNKPFTFKKSDLEDLSVVKKNEYDNLDKMEILIDQWINK